MKNSYKLSRLFTIAAVVSLCLATCADSGEEEQELEKGKPVHYESVLVINDEKIWALNNTTTKLSKVFQEFSENRRSIVEIIVFDSIVNNYDLIEIAAGEINNGILNITVPELNDDQLLPSEKLLNYFMEWHVVDDNDGNFDIIIKPETVKGNQITLFTDEGEALIEESFIGTYTSLSSEYVYYLYVNEDCIITAGKVENEELKYTYNAFSLSLKKGWNTICKTETYNTEGKSSYSMDVKHPDLRWTMWRGVKSNTDDEIDS